MLSKQMFKGIKPKLRRVCVVTLLLATVGLGFAAPAQAATTTRADANGSYQYRYRLAANNTQNFTWNLTQGQKVGVWVFGDGDTNLDLYVYDPYGRLLGQDRDDLFGAWVDFTASYTGAYTIQVVNRGSVYNDYDIAFDY